MKNEPAAGKVFWYPFLWKREQLEGETEGRKKRPVCIAVTISNHSQRDAHGLAVERPCMTINPMRLNSKNRPAPTSA